MTILNPTTEELEIIEEARQIAPLKEDWYIKSTSHSFCDWKYILLGIDPTQFIDRYGYIDIELREIYSISDDIQKKIKNFDIEFRGHEGWTSEFLNFCTENTRKGREIANRKRELLRKIQHILDGTLDLMLQSSHVEGYNALPTIGAYVLDGNNLQLMYNTQQRRVIPYGNNKDLFATDLGYVAEWYTHIKNVYPDLPLRISAEAMKNLKFLRIHSINSLKLKNLLELFVPLVEGKIKEVVLALFLQVLREALRSCNINEECVTLYIARDLFALFAGIKIEKNGIMHNPNGNTLKNWSFKTVNDLLTSRFTQSLEKTKDQRAERDRIIGNLKDYIVSSKESSVAINILKSVKS